MVSRTFRHADFKHEWYSPAKRKKNWRVTTVFCFLYACTEGSKNSYGYGIMNMMKGFETKRGMRVAGETLNYGYEYDRCASSVNCVKILNTVSLQEAVVQCKVE
jgi:hypothetical protein